MSRLEDDFRRNFIKEAKNNYLVKFVTAIESTQSKGIGDLLISTYKNNYILELKVGDNPLSPAQINFLNNKRCSFLCVKKKEKYFLYSIEYEKENLLIESDSIDSIIIFILQKGGDIRAKNKVFIKDELQITENKEIIS